MLVANCVFQSGKPCPFILGTITAVNVPFLKAGAVTALTGTLWQLAVGTYGTEPE